MKVEGAILADPSGSDHWVPVHDLSFEGFAIRSQEEFAPGSLCQCRFRAHPGSETILLAQVARSERAGDPEEFMTGFQFSKIEPDATERVKRLLVAIVPPAS